VTGKWKKLHSEEHNYLYSSFNIVRVIKCRRMRWVEHVARMRRGEACTWFWLGNRKEGDHLEDPSVDDRIILRYIFRKWNVRVWTGSSWLKIGTGGGNLRLR
jgi:hypothetical protein